MSTKLALTAAEERALGEAAQLGDQTAYKKLWEVALPLVPFVAKGLRRSGYLTPGMRDEEDMLQEGSIAIGEALKRWDPAQGRMSTFLVPRIRGALLDWTSEAHKGGIASKHTACTVVDLEEAAGSEDFEHQDQPGLHAQAAGFSRLDLLAYEGVYGGQGELDEASANPNARASELAAIVDDLNRLLCKLPADVAGMIRQHYGIGVPERTVDQIADSTGLSRRTVYRRIKDGVAQMHEMWGHF